MSRAIETTRRISAWPRRRRNQFVAAIQNWPTVKARLVSTMNFMKSRRST